MHFLLKSSLFETEKRVMVPGTLNNPPGKPRKIPLFLGLWLVLRGPSSWMEMNVVKPRLELPGGRPGFWLPAGRVDKGETLQEAFWRNWVGSSRSRGNGYLDVPLEVSKWFCQWCLIFFGRLNFKNGDVFLSGGFKYFLFSALLGEDSHFDEYFSNGLVQPPTRLILLRKVNHHPVTK